MFGSYRGELLCRLPLDQVTDVAYEQIALDMSNYAFVRNYVVKAESAIDAAQSTNGSKPKQAPVLLPGMVAPAQDPIEAAKERERKIVQERLLVAGGVAHLGSGNFEKAALAFTDLGSEAINNGTSHVRLLSYSPLTESLRLTRPKVHSWRRYRTLRCFDFSRLFRSRTTAYSSPRELKPSSFPRSRTLPP